jgi:FixJ family two-component response regulator
MAELPLERNCTTVYCDDPRSHPIPRDNSFAGRSLCTLVTASSKEPRLVNLAQQRVSIVDDDESMREALANVLRSLGHRVQVFASAEEFLFGDAVSRTDCLILDVSMPGMSGTELQLELERRGHAVPIVFITAQAGQSLRPSLIARGAVECLVKPFSEAALLAALRTALAKTDEAP